MPHYTCSQVAHNLDWCLEHFVLKYLETWPDSNLSSNASSSPSFCTKQNNTATIAMTTSCGFQLLKFSGLEFSQFGIGMEIEWQTAVEISVLCQTLSHPFFPWPLMSTHFFYMNYPVQLPSSTQITCKFPVYSITYSLCHNLLIWEIQWIMRTTIFYLRLYLQIFFLTLILMWHLKGNSLRMSWCVSYHQVYARASQ